MDTPKPIPQLSPELALQLNLLKSSVWMKTILSQFLEQFDITPSQYQILNLLKDTSDTPLSTQEIRALMIEKNSDCSRMVDRLIDKELAQKEASPIDKRKIQVQLTGHGRYLMSTINTKIKGLNTAFDTLSPEEILQLNALLIKLTS